MSDRKYGYYIVATGENGVIASNNNADFKIVFKDSIKIPPYSKVKVCSFYCNLATNFTPASGIAVVCPELANSSSIFPTGDSGMGLIYYAGMKISSNGTISNNTSANATTTNIQDTIYDTIDSPSININNAQNIVLNELNFKLLATNGSPLVNANINANVGSTTLSIYIGNDI
jgi:hypothetical protein